MKTHVLHACVHALLSTLQAGADVDDNGCSQGQVDADKDGVCNADMPLVLSGPNKGRYIPTPWCTGADNCKYVANQWQDDANHNGVGDACDTGECGLCPSQTQTRLVHETDVCRAPPLHSLLQGTHPPPPA